MSADPLCRVLQVRKHVWTGEVAIEIGPVVQTEGGRWECRYDLGGLFAVSPGRIVGGDAVEAMQLCLRFVHFLMSECAADRGFEVCWMEEGDRGGFGPQLPLE